MINIIHFQCCHVLTFGGNWKRMPQRLVIKRHKLNVSHGSFCVQPYYIHLTLYSDHLYFYFVYFPQLVYKILGVRNVCHRLSVPSCKSKMQIYSLVGFPFL